MLVRGGLKFGETCPLPGLCPVWFFFASHTAELRETGDTTHVSSDSVLRVEVKIIQNPDSEFWNVENDRHKAYYI